MVEGRASFPQQRTMGAAGPASQREVAFSLAASSSREVPSIRACTGYLADACGGQEQGGRTGSLGLAGGGRRRSLSKDLRACAGTHLILSIVRSFQVGSRSQKQPVMSIINEQT